MRIIDAESYEQALIANDWDKDTDEFSTEGVFELLHDEATIQAIVIPDNATNGDMIKAMFGSPAREGKAGILYKFKYRNGKPMFSTYFDFDWWNTPYRKRGKVNDESKYEIDYKQGYDRANDEWVDKVKQAREKIEKLRDEEIITNQRSEAPMEQYITEVGEGLELALDILDELIGSEGE